MLNMNIRIINFIIKTLLYLALYSLVFLLVCLTCKKKKKKKRDNDLLITSVFADSGDEDDSSPTENLPKIDKGKGRAVYTESLQDTEELDK